MQTLLHAWLERPLLPGACVTCGRSSTNQFCSSRCTNHFATLRAFSEQHMALGIKRLLEASDLDEMPLDVVEILLLVTYPLAERNAHQFQALARWRHVSQRYREVVDQRIFAQMRRLPRAFNAIATTSAVMRLFPNLRRVVWPQDDVVLPATTEKLRFWLDLPQPIMSQMLQRVDTLTCLELSAVGDCPLTNGVLAGLTSLTRLRLQTRGADPSLTGGQALSTLTRLQELAVQRNFDASALVSVTRLELLDNAYEVGVAPGITLLALTRVTHLTLGENRDVDNGTLAQLTQLTYLDTGAMLVGDDGLQPLTRLSHLRTIDTGRIANATLHGMDIETLELGGNSPLFMTIRELAPMQQLRRLVLRGYHGVSSVAVGELTQLTDLEIHRGYIFDREALFPLTRLQRLVLGVEVRSEIPDSRDWITNLGQLHTLGLGNQSSDWNWPLLTRITTLSLLEYSGVSGRSLERLTQLRRLILGQDLLASACQLPLLTELDLRPSSADLTRARPDLLAQLPPQCLVRSTAVYSL